MDVHARCGVSSRSRSLVVRFLPPLVACLFLGLFAAPLPLGAEEGFDPVFNFTIKSIEPDMAEKTVRIRFTAPVVHQQLVNALKFNPPAPLFWENSSITADGYLLTLRGNFSPGQEYYVVIPTTLRSGGQTYAPTNARFTYPDRLSQVSWVEPSLSVVERDSRQMIHAQVLNVERLRFDGLRVPPVLLPLALANESKEGADPIGDAERALKEALERIMAVVGKDSQWKPFMGAVEREGQLYFPGNERNAQEPFSLPLSSREKKSVGGIELARLVEETESSRKAATTTKILRITDLGLTYKIGASQILVWVTSLGSGNPVEGARLLAFDRAGGVLPLGATGKDGVLRIADGDNDYEGVMVGTDGAARQLRRTLKMQDVTFLLAATADDASFIEVKPTGDYRMEGIDQRAAQESGKAAKAAKAVKGHVFTERGIYRPGETVHFKGTVREFREGRILAPEKMKVKFTVKNSKGEESFAGEEDLSGFGTAAGEMAVRPFYPLGTYTLRMAYGPSDAEGVERTFQVQEFTPPRHFAEVGFTRAKRTDSSFVNRVRDQEILRVSIAGKYYAGGPVKNGKVRWKIYLTGTEHEVKGYDGYFFGNQAGKDEKGDLLESGESVLDPKGALSLDFPLERKVLGGNSGILVVATVVDFDGRTASESKLFQERPEFLVGIGPHPEEISAGEDQEIPLVVIDRDGKPVKGGTLSAEVLQQGHTYVQKRNAEGEVYWDYQEVWRKMVSSDLVLEKGRSMFSFALAYGGSFRLSFNYRAPSGTTCASSVRLSMGYGWWWWEEESPNREKAYDRLPITADKDVYKPGEEAVLRFFAQRLPSHFLVTLERDGILEYSVVRAQEGKKTLAIPVRESFAPNVYVSVMGVIPRGEFPLYQGSFDSEAPGYRHGTVNLSVSKGSADLDIAIAQKVDKLKGAPGQKMSIDLAARDREGRGVLAELAVAVVDERVLALTGFETPSLESLLDIKGPLGVFTGELRRRLGHQTPFGQAKNELLTGGDGLGKDAEAVTSKLRKDFNPVAYFNPAVVTDASGAATVTFTLPDTLTTYRVYAIGCDKGSRFASRQKALLAVKDFYLEPGVPRFFTRGDSFRFPVSAFNATGSLGQMAFSATATGGLSLSSEAASLSVPAQGSAIAMVRGEARLPGPAAMTFRGNMGGFEDAVELPAPVRSGFVIGTESAVGEFTGEGEVRMSLPDAVRGAPSREMGYEEVKVTLTVSGSPFLRMAPGLRYLLHYPYGCVEQTSSGVLPLAGLRSLIKDGLLPGIAVEETDKFLSKGVERLLSMQVESGGFGYWPGNQESHPWGSIYAGTALTLAKDAGFAVPPEKLNLLTGYLVQQMKDANHGADWTGYACFILAQNLALTPEVLAVASSRTGAQQREANLLLLAAAARQGLKSPAEAAAKAREHLARPWDPRTHYYWGARYREPAIALLVRTLLMPDDPENAAEAQALVRGINPQGYWSSSSDTGWSLYALGRYYSKAVFPAGKASLTVTQPDVPSQAAEVTPQSAASFLLDAPAFLRDPVVRLKADGGVTLLYRIELAAPRADWAVSGYSNGFSVNKSIASFEGGKEIRVGDMVKVTVSFTSEKNSRRDYVALDDPLPAGFVAINSALKTEETPSDQPEEGARRWYDEDGGYRAAPNFLELRDDRVLAFFDRIWGWGTYKFTYYARAVCEGEFVLPPTKVHEMYAPEVTGLTPKEKVVILGRR